MVKNVRLHLPLLLQAGTSWKISIPYDGREECWEIAPLLSRGSVEV